MASLEPMKQASLELNLSAKRTRKRAFLEQMERAGPWIKLVALIAPYYPERRSGRPPFALGAMRPGKLKKRDKANSPIDALIDKIEKLKARIRAKVKHSFSVLKRQFGFVKVRYRGLKKNTLQLKTLFVRSNLWMDRHRLMATQG